MDVLHGKIMFQKSDRPKRSQRHMMYKSATPLVGLIVTILTFPVTGFLGIPRTFGRSCNYLLHEQRQQQLEYPPSENPEFTFCVNGAYARRCRPRRDETRLAAEIGSSSSEASEREQVAIAAASAGVPRGPTGSLELTYLELNSWMCQANGLNILIDPVFGVLDFGVPALIQARKLVLWDSDRVTRDLAAITDFMVITQGFDDHCHPPTVRALSSLLDSSVDIIAPPSARAVLEECFDASRVTYLLPGETTVLSKGGRAVEVRATTGAVLGPPWQQAENGYIFRPVSVEGGGGKKVLEGGSFYYEPHLMFDEAELSQLKADVVIVPGTQQSLGPYTLVAGGLKTLELASLLKSSKVVSMPNADGDLSGPLASAITPGSKLKDFLDLTRTGCAESIEATVRKRRLCFAGFVMRMGDDRLPKRVMLGELEGGKRYAGGQEADWTKRLQEDIAAFGICTKKQGWEASAKRSEEWYAKAETGAELFMEEWHRSQADAKEKHQLKRDEAAKETAVEESKREQADHVARFMTD